MKFGVISIWVALISLVYSSWYYFQAIKIDRYKNRDNELFQYLIKQARFGFYVMTGWISLASVYLWYLIFTHQFQVKYIYSYTSSDLGIGYLFSAFWAGQEGSFLFWALMLAVLGVVFLRQAKSLETSAMLVVNIVQGAFVILLIKASPFVLSDGIPAEGAGLNPLLQNFWMVIHPPVLFVGYAAVTFPFAIAIAALLKREYTEWIKIALPWTLFASVTMGAGIIIGGYWAYKVLGWGGYWGWDPVENSSLMAWLIILALFHGLLVSRLKNGLQKTNFVLSIMGFVFVLYATFLTRSGVLADFSVHSFQDLGINGFLTIYMLGAVITGLGLLYQRKDEIPVIKISFEQLSKENILVFTILILVTSAFFITLGTSSPIITGFLGQPAQVEISFYNLVNLPIGILIALFLGIAPVLGWKGESFRIVLPKILVSIGIAVFTFIAAVFLEMNSLLKMLFLTTTMFALTSNLFVLVHRIKTGWKFLSAPVAHLGLIMMFLGIIVSAEFETSQRTVLTQNEVTNVIGHDLFYQGRFNSPDGKGGLLIKVDDGSSSFVANPRLYQNDYTRSEMREPYVEENLLSDLYLSPLQIIDQTASQSNLLTLTKGEKKNFGNYEIQFTAFDMTRHGENNGEFRVAAILQFSDDNTTVELKPAIYLKGQAKIDEPAKFTFSENQTSPAEISLTGINPDSKKIQLSFNGLQAGEQKPEVKNQVVIELSKKPFMSVLWLGTILLTIGSIIAMKRRSLEI